MQSIGRVCLTSSPASTGRLRWGLGAALLLAATLLPAQVFADGEVEARVTAGNDELTVGDPAELIIEVTHPSEFSVIIPRLPAQWGAFEVRSQSPVQQVSNEDGTLETSRVIEVALFAPGSFETPDLGVTVRDPSGRVYQQAVPPVSVTVVPVLLDGDTEMRDLKPQASLSVPSLWPWAAGTLLLVGLIVWAVYLLLKRRRSAEPPSELVVDTRPAYQIALEELARISELDLPGRGRFKEHYTLIADCIRGYIERMYVIPALDRTTDELRPALRRAAITFEHAARVEELLRECDLVKFTKLSPEVDTARVAVEHTRDLVEVTRLRDEPSLQEAAAL